MFQKSMVLALMIGCSSAAVHANTQVSQLNWQATASKDTNMEVSLTHSGLQAINSDPAQAPVQILAADLSHPDFNTTYRLQARALYGSLPQQDDLRITLALNGQPLAASHALPLAQATRYYLSYQADSARPDQVGEAAYELMVYWLG
ncbi:hypothetical protein ACF8OI_12095 [Aeromonas bivalvium]|uniref:hypothetical protein n=1 Tax=Aeromonas bivalvium TaxID=440079 RepID=UPI00370BC869